MKTAAPSGLRGELKACLCNVFGTVVDWRSGIVAQCERFARATGLDADWLVRYEQKWIDNLLDGANRFGAAAVSEMLAEVGVAAGSRVVGFMRRAGLTGQTLGNYIPSYPGAPGLSRCSGDELSGGIGTPACCSLSRSCWMPCWMPC